MANKIFLPNGCSMSTPSVNPKEWKDGGRELLRKNWQVQYYFYDPEFESKHLYGKLITVRGMNSYKTLIQRRLITEAIIENEINLCLDGYNHFTKTYINEEKSDYEIAPSTLFIDALKQACAKVSVVIGTRKGIEITVNHVEKSVTDLRLQRKTVSEIQRRNIKSLLENVEQRLGTSGYRYNKNRAHLSILYKYLVECETVEVNLIRDISKQTVIKQQREILTKEKLKEVLKYLEKNYPTYYVYVNVFFLAGVRSTELLSVQKKHVDLGKCEYKVLIKKGKQYSWETKVIILPAFTFWKEIISNCESDDDFIFSDNFKPGLKKAYLRKPGKWWTKYVKKEMGITADFYTLKHLFLDIVDSQNNGDYDLAQGMANHKSSAITDVYRTGKKKRELEKLKKLDFKF